MQQRQAKPVNTRPLDENGSLFGALERSADGLTTRPIQASPRDVFIGNILLGLADAVLGVSDVLTLLNPNAGVFQKGFAAITFAPLGKLFKEAKFLLKYIGFGEETAKMLKQFHKFTEPQVAKYKEFWKEILNVEQRNKLPITSYRLPNGGKALEVFEPAARAKGTGTYWEAYMDINGKYRILGHRTVDSKGRFLHWHEKRPQNGLAITDFDQYKERIEYWINEYEL